jgi:prepilin-type processing-associated H-X9-DG protein
MPVAQSNIDPDLIGYLLDALEPQERRTLDEALEASPELRQRLVALRRALRPLESDREVECPPNLLANTFKAVVAHRCRRTRPLLPLGPERPASRAWRRLDVAVAAAIGLVVLFLVPPALLKVRHREAVVQCADNLRLFALALNGYTQLEESQGRLPRPERTGPLAFAGSYAPLLHDAGCWPERMSSACPANVRDGRPRIPSVSTAELRAKFGTAEFDELARRMGGCYGFSLGYEDAAGNYLALHRKLGDLIPVMADRPPRPEETPDWRWVNSPNHGRGQNVLYLGGHVRYECFRRLGDDDIYLNANSRLAVGTGPTDAVLAPSEAVPFPARDAD